ILASRGRLSAPSDLGSLTRPRSPVFCLLRRLNLPKSNAIELRPETDRCHAGPHQDCVKHARLERKATVETIVMTFDTARSTGLLNWVRGPGLVPGRFTPAATRVAGVNFERPRSCAGEVPV